MSFLRSIEEEAGRLIAQGLWRQPRVVDGRQSVELSVDGRPVVNFASNNYLGLADHPAVIATAVAAMAKEGFGAGASRLVVGNLACHRRLEARIAAWQGTEAAVLFGSGYQANVGALPALVGTGDAIFSDALNHASIIDGARLSGARVFVYPHRDLEALARQLADGGRFRRRLVVSESLFSMEGDRAPIGDLAVLARHHDALLFLDDAHAVGALGERGVGLSRAADLRLGTLGKALGGFGAFVAGPQLLCDHLRQRARTFVYSTALPVAAAAWAEAAIELVGSSEGEERRARLSANVAHFYHRLAAFGYPARGDPSHVVPFVIGEPQRTMEASDRLLQLGIFSQGIRPPTVPDGTSRLRLSLSADHTRAHLEAALRGLAELCPAR